MPVLTQNMTMIQGTMPKRPRIMHTLGFVFLCTVFAGVGLLSLSFLLQASQTPSKAKPAAPGLFLASFVMIAVSAAGIGAQIWFRRRIVSEFSYDGSALRFSTMGRPARHPRDDSEIADIGEWRGRVGVLGYRLQFRDGGKLYLEYGVSNSGAAAEQISRNIRR